MPKWSNWRKELNASLEKMMERKQQKEFDEMKTDLMSEQYGTKMSQKCENRYYAHFCFDGKKAASQTRAWTLGNYNKDKWNKSWQAINSETKNNVSNSKEETKRRGRRKKKRKFEIKKCYLQLIYVVPGGCTNEDKRAGALLPLLLLLEWDDCVEGRGGVARRGVCWLDTDDFCEPRAECSRLLLASLRAESSDRCNKAAAADEADEADEDDEDDEDDEEANEEEEFEDEDEDEDESDDGRAP